VPQRLYVTVFGLAFGKTARSQVFFVEIMS